MIKVNDHLYIVNENSDKTLRIIFKEESHELYYQQLNNKQLDNFILIDNKVKSNLSIITLSNNDIYIFYKDLNDNVALYKFVNDTWSYSLLIENNLASTHKLSFTAITFKEKIFLFFKNYDIENNCCYIFYQELTENLTLSKSFLIDKVNFYYSNLLSIEILNDEIYIIYQKFNSNHLLGFKKLNLLLKEISNFNTIEFSKNPISNYSVIATETSIDIYSEKKFTIPLNSLPINSNNSIINSSTNNNSIINDSHYSFKLTLPTSDNLDKEFSSIEKNYSELLNEQEKKISTLENLISKLKNSSLEKNDDLITLKNSNQSLIDKTIKLTSSNSKLKEQNLNFEYSLLNLEKENSNLKSKLTKSKMENSKLQKEILYLKKELDDLSNKFKAFYNQLKKNSNI